MTVLLLACVATVAGFLGPLPARALSRANGASMAAPKKKATGPNFQSMDYWVCGHSHRSPLSLNAARPAALPRRPLILLLCASQDNVMKDARKEREKKDRERTQLKRSKGIAIPVPPKQKAAARPAARAVVTSAKGRMTPSGRLPSKAAAPAASAPAYKTIEFPKLPTLPDLSDPGDGAHTVLMEISLLTP